MSFNLSELSGRKGMENNLFDRMGKLAREEGTPSIEALDQLAEEFLVGKANTYGAISFYDFLKPENRDKKVYLCNGSACQCAGTQDEVSEQLQAHFKASEIGHMTCLGRCHENAAFHYQGANYSGTAIQQLDTIVNGEGFESKDEYQVGHNGQAVLTRPFPGVEKFYAPFLKALKQPSADLLAAITESGLRGRGGAGFPISKKLDFCRMAEGDLKFVICNADEGDPGAYSDRYLMEEQPHAVLLGMLISGFITGAQQGIVYLRAEYPAAAKVTQAAINELQKVGLLGEQIGGTDFSFQIRLIQAQGSYICGEETALINSIEGQRPEVRVRPPYPAQQGLFNKPTLVNNVETLAALGFILENGGGAWKSIGTERSSGTKLVSLDSLFKKPGIYEVEMGTPLSEVVFTLGGGFKKPVKALHIGGPLGGLVPYWKIQDLKIDFESFAEHGFLLGHASVVSIPSEIPMLEYLQHLLSFAAYESCGKCFPCRLGTQRGAEMLEQAVAGRATIERQLFDDLLETLEKGSLCAHGGGIPLPIRNALHYFSDELKPYFR